MKGGTAGMPQQGLQVRVAACGVLMRRWAPVSLLLDGALLCDMEQPHCWAKSWTRAQQPLSDDHMESSRFLWP